MQQLKQKQKYLRDNIPSNLYDEFTDYLSQNIGNTDIESWSHQFTVEVVKNFKEHIECNERETNSHQTSFYNYQQQPQQEIKSIGSHNQKKKSPLPNITELQVSSNQSEGKSALNLFETIFDPNTINGKNQIGKASSVTPKILPPLNEYAFKTVEPSYFDNKQFWGLQLGANNHSNNVRLKQSKSTTDFSSFDFWSQPSSANSSPQQFNTSYEVNCSKSTSFGQNKKGNSIPTFDQLMAATNKEKEKEKQREKQILKEREKQREKQKQKQKLPSPYLKKATYPQDNAISPIVVKPGKIPYDGQVVLKTEFKDSLKCFPSSQRKNLSHPDLSVTIQNHEIVQRTFLMPDYAMYSLKIHPTNIICKRNYQDFTRLKSTLQAFYPGLKLSYLEKNSWFYSTNIQFINKQKFMLQAFINDLIKNKQIKNSRIFEDFLTITEHKKIKRKFQQYQKLEKPKCIQDLCLLQGKVDVNISENQRIYQQNLKRYQQKLMNYLQRSEKLNEVLSEQYKQVKNTLASLSELAASVMQETHRFNERVYDLQLEQVKQIFRVIKNSYSEQVKNITFTIDMIGGKVLPFLNFQKQNLRQFQNQINIQQTFFRSYLKRSQIQKLDPNIPYTSDKIKSSKLSILEQSRNIQVMKYQTGYLSNQICHEAKRVYQTLALKYKKVWDDYSTRSRQQCMKNLQFWKLISRSNSQPRRP